MHDCRKVKSKLIDLVFHEAGPNEKLRLIAEVDGCDLCLELYRSMTETLGVFDTAIEAGMPEESYWSGYEDRLRARLIRDPQPSIWRRQLDRLRNPGALLALPLYVKVGFALLVLSPGLWLTYFRQASESRPGPNVIAGPPPGASTVPEVRAPEIVSPAPIQPEVAKVNNQRKKTVRIYGKNREAAGRFESTRNPALRNGVEDALSAESANHIEKTELLFRAFRNIRHSDDEAGIDLSFEKRMSRELLAKSMLLRRRLGNKDYRITEELLASVEPLLLDIANLPERASESEVRAVKELIRKQEIIATLQLYSARALSRVTNRKNYDFQ
ncbi:MAG TPA: hypothetical protein VFQ92_08315 [Blastocatellia bacterium]|nr:hypothetical protein [Blastocatellia bacterium]